MKLSSKIFNLTLVCAATFLLSSCSTTSMKLSEQPKPGFSNITDIPLPQSANMDMSKSMVMGGGSAWTGHLVYDTNKSPAQVVDFINSSMQDTDWVKLSELRGKQTVLLFMKENRIASVKVSTDNLYFSNKTLVSIDMTTTKLRMNAIVDKKSAVE